MTFSVRDLAGQIGGGKDAAGRLAASITAAKSDVDELLDAFREMGVEGGASYQNLVATGERLELVERVRAEVEGGLEKARFIAMSAITGMHAGGGGGGGAVVPLSPAAVDDPATWEKPVEGGDLVSPAEPKRGKLSGLVKAATNDNAMDGAKTLSESAANIADAFAREFGPPITETNASAEVPTGPVFRAPEKTPIGTGNAAMGVLALSVVVTKGTETVSKAANKWFGKTREHETDG